MKRPDRRGQVGEQSRERERCSRRASAIITTGIRVCSTLPRRKLRGISTLMRILCAASGEELTLTAIKTGIRAGMARLNIARPGLSWSGLALLGLLLAGTASAEQAAEPLAKLELGPHELGPHELAPLELAPLEQEGWYLTEILIFIQDDEAALGAEFWDPLPELSYPENYRYPIDLQRLDRRADENLALASRVDARGVQSLTLPWPVTALDLAPREDALIEQPSLAEHPHAEDANSADPNAARLNVENSPAQDLDAADVYAVDPDAARRDANFAEPGAGESARVADSNAALAEPRRLLKALPYALLEPERLEFADQAQALRDGGQRILFHSAWWAPLREGDSPLPLVVDRAADPDTDSWPELQGSIHLYRSRYLHIELDLWLNTPASYLPPGWRIEPAPRPQPSLRGATPDGQPFDPWKPPPVLNAEPDTALTGADERPGNPALRGERFSSGDERFPMGDARFSTGDGSLSTDGGRVSAGGGRISTDGGRVSAGGGGFSNGGGRVSAGGGRISAGGGRLSNDGGRVSAGDGRLSNDGGRVSAGGGRVSNGGGRVSNGGGRISAGGGRVSAGDGRLSNDGGRFSAGDGRVSAGGGRISNGGGKLSADGAGRSIGDEGLPAATDTAFAAGALAAGNEDTIATGPPWSWKHAIVHRQARRMRSNEVHYLDHPVIGVVVKVRPLSEDNLPLERDHDAAAARRERHGLALDYLEIAPREEP